MIFRTTPRYVGNLSYQFGGNSSQTKIMDLDIDNLLPKVEKNISDLARRFLMFLPESSICSVVSYANCMYEISFWLRSVIPLTLGKRVSSLEI